MSRSGNGFRRALYSPSRFQAPLLPNTVCSSRVLLEAELVGEHTEAVLRALKEPILANVDWRLPNVIETLAPEARAAYEEFAAFALTITQEQVTTILHSAYDLDEGIAQMLHHVWWDAERVLCRELEVAVTENNRGAGPLTYGRFWAGSATGYRMGFGQRTWLCLWEPHPLRVAHIHTREYRC